ncbi:hypothetical protein R69927_05094 [Paraburkholderia domus]|jgi:hypothetical protein|uniref:Uncharacterized protein n=1 Tax=Paraburkholderia domus TaxID=2793075 RepID=A0A9N8N290_9BURK|nr:hypothetical protein [Paraburkholderia domus]MBK5050289.1 hypothetical protein [Burkholderia sp. R-70006]MBK5062424.1 hypothetical protein [Burkholderia sp. R-70199]MBK5089299.1 hypothetical protein [Burkholderia sp. R-69927]MBK5183372.1 hypothetical protein [Burkholderia sp. R-69749]CAE6718897.1 hypothetical protein R70006_01592 [Paraburkholderia domus]
MLPWKPRVRRNEPSELDKLRFDYAWKWFSFHAEQRTKMFNFMLVGLGALATVVVTAINDHLVLVARFACGLGFVIALVFWRLDGRNRTLYDYAGDILIDLEDKVIFGQGRTLKNRDKKIVTYGIYQRVKLLNELNEIKPWWKRRLLITWAGVAGIVEGKHRHLMPAVALMFAIFFAIVFVKATTFSEVVKNTPTGCCTDSSCDPACHIGFTWPPIAPAPPPPQMVPQATLVSSVKFTGFEKGLNLLECDEHDNADKLNQLRAAIHDAQKLKLRVVVFLIGSTDRTPLSRELRKQFESNAGLARARVSTVERCLDARQESDAQPQSTQPEMVRLVSGPSYVPPSQEPAEVVKEMMAADRGVAVLVMGFPMGIASTQQ